VSAALWTLPADSFTMVPGTDWRFAIPPKSPHARTTPWAPAGDCSSATQDPIATHTERGPLEWNIEISESDSAAKGRFHTTDTTVRSPEETHADDQS
jgi:hypothetical protein